MLSLAIECFSLNIQYCSPPLSLSLCHVHFAQSFCEINRDYVARCFICQSLASIPSGMWFSIDWRHIKFVHCIFIEFSMLIAASKITHKMVRACVTFIRCELGQAMHCVVYTERRYCIVGFCRAPRVSGVRINGLI